MDIRALLREVDIRPSKGLGQHFMVDRKALEQIVEAAELGPEETVLEIGPGPGTLTRALADRAGRVIAVELDGRMVEILSQTLGDRSNVEIVQGDILKLDPAELVEGARYTVVANLPYYITSALLRHLLEATVKPHRIVVTVQREVAERLVARPGQMSLLSVSVQFYGHPRLVARIPARAFYPAPKVNSAVVRIDLYERPPVEVEDVDRFFEIVRAGFAQRRKQLRNSLARGLGMEPNVVAEALSRCAIDPTRRAQTLSVEEWGKVYREFVKREG